jgi:thiopeptide-type bacteriocin biosynthesis protein
VQSSWRAIYLFVGQAEHIDELALITDRALRSLTNAYDDWFFIRYPEAGLHIRIRIGERAAAVYPMVMDRLTAACKGLATREPPHPSVIDFGHVDSLGRRFAPGEHFETAYEPETVRYGGESALEINEHLFRISSGIAVSAIARTSHDRKKRLTLASDLMLMTAASIADLVEPQSFIAEYAAAWRNLWPSTPANNPDQMPQTGAALPRLAALHKMLDGSSAQPNLTSSWGVALSQARSRFRSVFDAGQLVSPKSGRLLTREIDYPLALRSMFASQLHMLNNRLGFWPNAEIQMGEWLSEALKSQQ